METEHPDDVEALQFLDNLELRPGLNGARFVRFRSESGGNSFVYFVEPQPTSTTIVSN